MKRPSHATVIAYLALFIALGSGAYAATQLPKNSVGPKQLQKNAVATPKIKSGAVTEAKIGNDAVTGAKVDETTLGKVPSAAAADIAASATSATSATSAENAAALGGVPSAGFLKAGDVLFGAATPQTLKLEPLFTAPGRFRLTTAGENVDELKVRFQNLSSTPWYYISRDGLLFLGPGASNDFDTPGVGFQTTIVAVDSTDAANHVVIDCARMTPGPSVILCSGRVPPAS
jgi:hypothetical protein